MNRIDEESDYKFQKTSYHDSFVLQQEYIIERESITQSSRKIFYTKTVILRSTVTMKLTWSSPSYLTLQSEIQLFLDRQIPSQLSGEMPQTLKFEENSTVEYHLP